MRVFLFITMLLLVSVAIAQKPKKPLSTNANYHEIFKKQGEALFQTGEYKRCLIYLNLANEHKKDIEITTRIEKVKQLEKIQSQALTHFLNRKWAESQSLYKKILAENPSDKNAQNNLTNIGTIQNNPSPKNDLDYYVAKGDEYIAKGLFQKAREYYAIATTQDGPYNKKSYAKAKIEQVNQVNEQIKQIASSNSAKAKKQLEQLKTLPIGAGIQEYINIEIAEIKLNETKFNRLQNQAKQAFIRGNYCGALAKVKEARKIERYHNSLSKEKNLYQDLGRLRTEFNELATRKDGDFKIYIKDDYLKITSKNPSDTTIKNDYYTFLRGRILKSADCRDITDMANEMLSVNANSEEAKTIQTLKDGCDKKLMCEAKKGIVWSSYNLAKTKKGNASTLKIFNEVRDDLKRVKNDLASLKDCLETFKVDSVSQEIADTLIALEAKINKQKCFEINTSLLTQADSLVTEQQCGFALEAYKKIVVECIASQESNQLQNKIKRAEICNSNQLYKLFLDSAFTQKSKRLYLDEIRLYYKAKDNALDSARKVQILTLIAQYNCEHHQTDCEKIIDLTDPCTDTTTRAIKLDINMGLDLPLKNGITSIKVIGTNNVIPLIFENGISYGARLHFVNFKKRLDYRMGILSGWQAFNTLYYATNSFTSGRIAIQSVHASFDVKWHTKTRCSDEPRMFIAAGLLIGKNFISNTTINGNYKQQIENEITSLNGGISLSTGVELFRRKKTGLSLEIFYNQKAGILSKTTKKLYNPFDSYFNASILGIKISTILDVKSR